MHQTGDTHPQLTGLGPQAQVQPAFQRQAAFLDIATVTLHIQQAERQGRLIDIAQHLAEEPFMGLAAHTQAGLGHIVAIRHRGTELAGQAEQVRLHILAHHVHRGVVQGHMMEQQHRHPALVRRVLGKDQAHQRRLGQVQARMTGVETLMQLLGDLALGGVEFHLFQIQPSLAPDHLHRCLQPLPKHGGAQDVMALDDALQGIDKGTQALATGHLEQGLQDIRIALLGRQVVIKNPFLQRCQRVDILHIGHAARHAGDNMIDSRLVEIGQRQQVRCDPGTAGLNGIGRDLYFIAATDGGRQRGQGRLAEQHTHIGAQAGLAHTFDQAHGQQRVPAQFEEVIVTPDPLDLEHLGPDRRQGGFDHAFGRLVATADQGLRIRCRQGLAVQLAVRRQRQRVETHIGRGHHVVRQAGLQMAAQGFDIQRLLWLAQGEIGHQAFFTSVLPRQQHRVLYRRVRDQSGLDFTQFDTETTDLHLTVVTAEVFQVTVRPPATEVTGAVQQCPFQIAERIGDKLRRTQFRPVQITLGHALAADIQLTGHAYRHRLTAGIQHIDLAVADRSTDGNSAAAHRSDLVGRGKGRGLGRAIAVEQMLRCALHQYPGNDRRVQHVATDNQVAQASEDLHQAVGVLMEQASGQPQHADRLRQQQRPEFILGQQYRVLDHHHATAIEQRCPDIQGAGVKGRIGGEGHAILRIEVGVAVVDHQAADGPVRNPHPLGRPG
ncbi:hypothetical protein UCMB321_2188 [Pseudomonas batumici]|uniref:Uncharacterized protein n=1 Tax=Pseudomonas batumici TaxID=226910 RepID=A0A0C2I4C2_9PSED|nr:hypothetical protein UCMB321_2188 [Pseudomonas batumici]